MDIKNRSIHDVYRSLHSIFSWIMGSEREKSISKYWWCLAVGSWAYQFINVSYHYPLPLSFLLISDFFFFFFKLKKEKKGKTLSQASVEDRTAKRRKQSHSSTLNVSNGLCFRRSKVGYTRRVAVQRFVTHRKSTSLILHLLLYHTISIYPKDVS